jgi:serine protease AprX
MASVGLKGISWTRKGVAWRRPVAILTVLSGTAALTLPAASAGPAAGSGPSQSVIVEFGQSPADAMNLVDSVLPHGLAAKAFDAIAGVEVSVPPPMLARLQDAGAVVVPDAPVTFASTNSASSCPALGTSSTPSGSFVQDTGADQLAARGDTGQGATVAVLDTGIDGNLPDFSGRLVGGVDLTGGNSPFSDEYGHGTFVAGLIAGNGASSNGQYPGEAPGANLVSIKVAGATGDTRLSTVIEGIGWAIAHRSMYRINVLNLSLAAVPTGPTFIEPLDQAVEAAWRAGITVVTAAGNSGPASGTIASPGDDPLVITAGAYADNGSPSPANWYGCSFSAVGPTAYDGWLKPDLAAPGRSVISLLDPGSTIAQQNPQAVVGTANFVGSGTSFSAAITSGAAALVLTANSGLAPADVKGRLLADALPSETQAPLIEGHGFLDAFHAATGPAVTYRQNSVVAQEWADLFTTPTLGGSWQVSSWNPANWTGSAWTGAAWNGSAWTGSAWTGAAWNGSAWTGSAWTGSAWTGSAWTGSAWTGSAWTGSAWTGSAWTGSAWSGSAWSGSAWSGSAWSGSAWSGSAWSGSAWSGSAWSGSAWS